MPTIFRSGTDGFTRTDRSVPAWRGRHIARLHPSV